MSIGNHPHELPGTCFWGLSGESDGEFSYAFLGLHTWSRLDRSRQHITIRTGFCLAWESCPCCNFGLKNLPRTLPSLSTMLATTNLSPNPLFWLNDRNHRAASLTNSIKSLMFPPIGLTKTSSEVANPAEAKIACEGLSMPRFCQSC